MVVVLLATLTHFHFDPTPALVAWRWHRALRFVTTGADVVDAARNVLLFAGFGAVWLVTSPRSHPWRRVAWITLAGCVLSVGVEMAQLFSAARTSSVNDVTTNTLGALLGAAGIVVMARVLSRLEPRARAIGVPLLAIAASYVAAVMAEMFSPLYRSKRTMWPGGSIEHRLMNALHHVRPFGVGRMSVTDMVLFAPAGALLEFALAELGVGAGVAAVVSMVVCALLAVGVEILHGIAGQPIDLSAIAGHAMAMAAGAGVGWWVGPRAVTARSERWRARWAIGMLVVLLIAWAWRPFVLRLSWQAVRTQVTMEHLTPLGVLGASSDLLGVMDVAEQFFLYISLGALLAAWPLRHRGRLSHVWPAVYLAVVLEVGQILVLNRTFDVTDLLTQCAAICVGFVVVRRAGTEARGELLGGGAS